MQSVAIIRQRGQLTLPDPIREALPWLKTHSAVTISVKSENVIEITPQQFSQNQVVDWDKIERGLARAQTYGSKNHISTTEFLQKDRARL